MSANKLRVLDLFAGILSVDSALALSGQDLKQLRSVRLNHTRRRFWQSIGRESRFMTMLENSQQSDWLQTELESMSSREDFHVQTSVLQANRPESVKAPEADYGQKSLDLLASYDHDT
jgi:hypothetical protein